MARHAQSHTVHSQLNVCGCDMQIRLETGVWEFVFTREKGSNKRNALKEIQDATIWCLKVRDLVDPDVT